VSKPPHSPWRIKLNAPFIVVIRQTRYLLADSLRKDQSPANCEDCYAKYEEVEALKRFAFYECASTGPDGSFVKLAPSKSIPGAVFEMRRVGPWCAYCYVHAHISKIEWVTAIHDSQFRDLSLAVFLRDASGRY
jgi:hypothetical protein